MTLNELINELSAISRRMSTGDVPLLDFLHLLINNCLTK